MVSTVEQLRAANTVVAELVASIRDLTRSESDPSRLRNYSEAVVASRVAAKAGDELARRLTLAIAAAEESEVQDA